MQGAGKGNDSVVLFLLPASCILTQITLNAEIYTTHLLQCGSLALTKKPSGGGFDRRSHVPKRSAV